MALSNWDTLAVDQDGQPSSGSFTSPLGVEISVYKNWLYVRDPKAWRAGGGYVEPTVMEISSGSFRYQDVSILAWRGPQNGVYAMVWHTRYQEQDKPTPANPRPAYKPPVITGMVGVGVYGFEGDEFVGVTTESVAWFREHVKQAEESPCDVLLKAFEDACTEGCLRRFNQGDGYFTENLGTDLQASAPGEASTPVMLRMLGVESED